MYNSFYFCNTNHCILTPIVQPHHIQNLPLALNTCSKTVQQNNNNLNSQLKLFVTIIRVHRFEHTSQYGTHNMHSCHSLNKYPGTLEHNYVLNWVAVNYGILSSCQLPYVGDGGVGYIMFITIVWIGLMTEIELFTKDPTH